MLGNDSMMDLFQNYSSMRHYVFDKSLKHEYVNTLKFQFTLKGCRMRMYIDNDCGYQEQNDKLIGKIVDVYKNIMETKNILDD